MADGRIIIDTQIDNSGAEKGIGKLNSIAKNGLKIFTGAIASTGTAMTGIGIKAIGLASDLEEVQNVVDVTFGKNANEINNWAKRAANAFGLSELQAKQFNGTMGAMLKSMGLVDNQVLSMSESMTGLSADFASFYNLPIEQAFEKIRAGISGETEPLKQLGINMSVANLEAYALAEGLSKPYNKMTQSEQALLRYNYLMSVSADAQGDFNRTQDSFANQMRISQLNLQSLSADIGKLLLPIAQEAVTSFNDIAGKLREAFNNPDVQESVVKLAESIGELITKVASFVADHLPGIINGLAWILDNAGTISSVIAGIGTAMLTMNVANMITGLVEAFKAFKLANEGATVAQWLLNTAMNANPVVLIVSLIAGLIAAIIVLWNTNEDFRNFWINAWESIKQGVINAWNSVSKFFTETIPETFDNMIQSIIDWKNDVIQYFKDMYTNTKQAISDWANGVKESFVQWKNDTIATIKGWGQSISDFFTETIPEWINSIAEWFGQLPYRIGYKLGEAAVRIYLWGQEVWTFFTETIPNWIESISQCFSELPGKIWSWLVETYNKFIQWKDETKEAIRQFGIDMIMSFSNWISETYNKVSTWTSDMCNKAVEMASNFINSIIEWFRQLPTRISNWLTETINKVVQWKNDLVQTARRAAQDFFNSIVQKAKEIPGQMLNIGKNIVQGVWNGIVGAKDWFMGKVGDFFSGIVDGAKSVLGIHSPSRVFRDQVGKYMAQGVSVGFEKETSNVQSSIEDNLFDLTAKMKATVNYEVGRNNTRVVDKNSYLSADNKSVDPRDIINSINKIASRPIDNRIVIDGREVAMATAPYQDEWERWNEGR